MNTWPVGSPAFRLNGMVVLAAAWLSCPVKLAILVAYTVAFFPVMASVVIAVLAG